MINSIVKKILGLRNEDIDQIDLNRFKTTVDHDFIKTFLAPSGTEHYKLLAYIAGLFNNIKILDIGTYKGYSALALSHNLNNKVYSYDINDQRYKIDAKNIDFRISEAMNFEDFKSVELILLDTYHDGVYEKQFINHLKAIEWHGILLMDDIHYFDDLKALWTQLDLDKHDITSIGHWSGTGMIQF